MRIWCPKCLKNVLCDQICTFKFHWKSYHMLLDLGLIKNEQGN